MAEVIQFNCPVCGTLLRLPLAMAAQQGPCPHCQQEIVAPDPYRGIGAHEAVPPVMPKVPEASPLFAETPPLVPKVRESLEKTAEPEQLRSAPAEVEIITPPVLVVPPEKSPSRGMMLLACWFAGAVGLAMGYAYGVRTSKCSSVNSAATQPLEIAPKVEAVSAPVLVEPTPPPEPAPSVKVSAAAEASLRAFLEAPDWAARSAHVLFPEKVRSAMEAYSRETPDGPTAFKSIAVKQSQIDETTGNTLLIFYVTTTQHPGGIPVAIQETPNGWLVDWATFVEFRDGLFEKFAEGPAEKPGFFHLGVALPSPERATNTANESFSSYLLQSPIADKARLAYVKKNTPVAATLEAQTTNARPYAPVLELVKRTTPDKREYLEILSVKADDWIPRAN